MPKYTFQIIHKNSNFREDFIFDEWISAPTQHEAQQDIERVYPYMEGYTCTLIDEENE
jgi:hypothetical protein